MLYEVITNFEVLFQRAEDLLAVEERYAVVGNPGPVCRVKISELDVPVEGAEGREPGISVNPVGHAVKGSYNFV